MHLSDRDQPHASVITLPEGVIHRLIVAVERPVGDDDALQPFHRRHPVPAGHDRPQRKPVRRRERLAIHLVGEKDALERLAQRDTARVMDLARRLGRIADFAPVRALEDDLGCSGLDPARAQDLA